MKYTTLIILFILTGCSTTKSSNTNATWYCLNKVFEYEDKCNCTLYPRGVTKETYCDTWANLTLQGYNVKLEIPTN